MIDTGDPLAIVEKAIADCKTQFDANCRARLMDGVGDPNALMASSGWAHGVQETIDFIEGRIKTLISEDDDQQEVK